MFTMGTQFNITEKGEEALQDLRQSDMSSWSQTGSLNYILLTALDRESPSTFQGILAHAPRSSYDSNISDSLDILRGKGWITADG